jgi:beta-glucanase (GH16 family)
MRGWLPVTLTAALALAPAPAVANAGPGDVKASVPSTLALSVGDPGDFGALTPGISKDYETAMTASVISTAGAATLSVTDSSTDSPGHLLNGPYALPSALRARASSPVAAGGPFAPVGANASLLLSYAGPVSNDPVTLLFQQHVDAGDALRTGAYRKTLTFTLVMQEGGPESIAVDSVPDAVSIVAGADAGFKVTVANPTSSTAQSVTLSDALPAGNNLSWVVDARDGIAGCKAQGEVGAQSVACPAIDLPAGASYSIHIKSHTSPSTAAEIVNKAFATSPNAGDDTGTGTLAVTAATCKGAAPDPSRTLAFDDEFTTDTVDPTKWTRDALPFGGYQGSTHYHNTQYGSYIIPENLTQHDGLADLQTNNVPITPTDPPLTFKYTEAMMHTKGKFSRTGGYFEICAKFPQGKGLWPAFWLAAQNGNWPPEMDIAEWFGSIEGMQIGQPFATGSNAGNLWQSAWFYGNEPTKEYHRYGMWWTTSSPAKILYYIDGRMVHEIDGTTSNLISNTPMYIILNSGTWAPATRGGPPDDTTVFPNSFLVDYVRVYTTPPPVGPGSAG